ncbi:hypothetical protein AUP68_15872 [Ilyonectria robusta]
MFRSKPQYEPEAVRLSPADLEKRDDSIDRVNSPSIIKSVLQPLEQKMHEYDVLMHQAHQESMQLDEEIRIMQQQRFLAEERFMAARARHSEYEQHRRDVSRALQGEPKPLPYRELTPQTRIYNCDNQMQAHNTQNRTQMTRIDSFDNQVQTEKIQTKTQTPAKLGPLDPSDYFTNHQIFYVFIMAGIGGMIISGGINFGLAYVMYTTQNTVLNPIYLFQLPNTLAGDAAVTIIIQCIITWFMEKGLVAHDLSRRGVQPIGFISKPTRPWQRRLFFLPPLGYDEAIDAEAKGEPQAKAVAPDFLTILGSVVQHALRGFLIAIVSFFLLWPATVGILIAFGKSTGGDYIYDDRWVPQIFKGILGGLLGLLTTPLMALFWLVKAGWEGNPHWSLKS